jgi:hypothetical protein
MDSEDTFRWDGGINCPSPEPGAGAPIARDPDTAGALPAPPANSRFKPLKDWFTFENRCLVCGRKFFGGSMEHNALLSYHLLAHCDEGVMRRFRRRKPTCHRIDLYEQVKAHPVGFPGILLPKEMEWSK